MSTTLVTGLWDIKREDLDLHWKRDFKDHYLAKFVELLKVSENLIVFGEEELEEVVFTHRSKENTQFILREKSWFKNEFYDNIQLIRKDSNWLNQAGWLKDSTQAKLEMYNPLVMSKMFLLNDARILDKFNSEQLFWIDAGISNTVHIGYFTHDKVLSKLETKLDKFHFVCFPYKADNEIHGFSYPEINEFANDDVKIVARGGFFGGPKHTIEKVSSLYYNLLSSTLSEKFMGTEESIFSIMCYLHPEYISYSLIKENGLLSKFFEDIKLTKTPGFSPSYKLQKYSLDQIFNASLYNFNPEVRDEVLNDLNDILSQKVTTKTKGDIRNQFLKNKRLTELGINKRLQGPITRLLMKDINEDIVENLKFIKQPIRGTPNLLNYLKDKVDPKYRKQFDLASKAITQIQAKKYDGAKETLKIAENINFDHKVPQSVIELGYADEIEFAKVNPVGEDFNQNIKRTQFDSKINRLIKVYEATPDKDKSKIIQKMNEVKNNFNKRYNNYLSDLSIKQVNGKLNFSSKGKVFKTSADITKALQNNFKQNPQLFQLAESVYGGVCRVKKSTGGRVPGEDYNTCIARNLNETIGDATNVSDKAKSGKAINKLSELTNVAKAAKYGKNALRGLQAILVGTGVGEIALTAALEGLGPIEGAVEGEDLTRNYYHY